MTTRREGVRAVKGVDVKGIVATSDDAIDGRSKRRKRQPTTTAPVKISGSSEVLHELRKTNSVRHPLELPRVSGVNALSLAIRYLPGGRKMFMEFVKLAALNGDPSAKSFWNVWAGLTHAQRLRVNLDDVGEAAGVTVGQILAAIVGHGADAMKDVAHLVGAAFLPEVIEAAGKSARRISGDHAEIAARDRTQLMQAHGFLPVPKGASIHVHNTASANAQAAAVVAQNPSVPKFSADMETLRIPRTTVQRQLAESNPDEEAIEAEAVHAMD